MDINSIQHQKAVGNFKPNSYLSNLAMAHFEEPEYAHKRLFPVVQVNLPSGFFYEFSRADLARDGVRLKPDYGAVQPTVMGHADQSYSCKVYQVMMGLDQIITLPYERLGNPGIDPRRARTKMIVEQIALHQEIDFAQKFFKAGVWQNEWTGNASDNYGQKKFKKFSSDTDPVAFIDKIKTEIKRTGRRSPNKLALGMETFSAMKNNKYILERIKYSGTTQNPSVVNENVLAQIFGVDQVIVCDATYNAAGIGEPENLQFVCDSKGALLLYAPDAPMIDQPSAGYTFTWNISGNNYIAINQFEKQDGSHTDFIEAVIAYDQKLTSQALGCFLADCVG